MSKSGEIKNHMALFIGIATFFGIFALFLVLGKSLNNTINHIVKITYLLQKEFDLKKERLVIAQMLEEEKNEPGQEEEAAISTENGGMNSSNNGKQ
jgi:hypothetical protein